MVYPPTPPYLPHLSAVEVERRRRRRRRRRLYRHMTDGGGGGGGGCRELSQEYLAPSSSSSL